MNRPSQLSLSFCIHSGPLLGKMFKQFLHKYQYQSILIFLVIWIRMIRLKYNSFNTDMGSQMMQSKKETQKKNINFVFAVHIVDFMTLR